MTISAHPPAVKRYVYTWDEMRGGYTGMDASGAGRPIVLADDYEALLSERDALLATTAKLRERNEAMATLTDEAAMLLRGWRNTHQMNRHENSPINSTRDWLSRFDKDLPTPSVTP